MAETDKQAPRPWKARFLGHIFLEGAPTLVQADRGTLDTTSTAAKASGAELTLVSRGLLIRYKVTKPAAGEEKPTTTMMAVLVPYAQVTQLYMPSDWRG